MGDIIKLQGSSKYSKIGWSAERIEALRLMFHEGLTHSEIAARLGGVSRNAVIGKASRLGLTGRQITSTPKSRAAAKQRAKDYLNKKLRKPPRPAPRAFGPRSAALSSEPLPEPDVYDVPRKHIEQLADHDCRWPVTLPNGKHHYCALARVAGLPYCEVHARRATAQPTPRRRSEPEQPPAPTAPEVAELALVYV